jgi:hypothetical protein
MTDGATEELLQRVLRRESLALLQYVRDAFPWTRAGEDKALVDLREVIEEDRRALMDLGRFLTRCRVPLPYVGSYPADFTTVNFISLDYLLPRLLAEQRREVGTLEAEVPAATDSEAREQLVRLLDVKRRHLGVLERLAADNRQPAVRT